MTHPFNIVFCANQELTVLKTIDYLKEKSYTTFFTETESDLLNILNKQNIHLVIVELDFKNKDGISITNEIRNLKTIEQPFIIIFTNKADDYIQITAFNAGADDFIITPIKPALLEPRIAMLKKRYLSKKNIDTEKLSIKKFHEIGRASCRERVCCKV